MRRAACPARTLQRGPRSGKSTLSSEPSPKTRRRATLFAKSCTRLSNARHRCRGSPAGQIDGGQGDIPSPLQESVMYRNRLLVTAGLLLSFWLTNVPYVQAQPLLIGVNVQEAGSPEARQLGVTARSGAVVIKVFPGYAAERAGLAAGDVIVGCGDRQIATCDDLRRVISASSEGNRHRLTVQRRSASVVLDLVLSRPTVPPRPSTLPPAGATSGGSTSREPHLGMNLRSAGHPETIALGIESPTGVAVMRVTPQAPADQAGLRRGDLIVHFGDRETETFEDLEAATLRAPLGSRQTVVFVRGNRRLRTKLIVESRPAQYPTRWFEHPEGGFRFLYPGRWTGVSLLDPGNPDQSAAAQLTSTEGATN